MANLHIREEKEEEEARLEKRIPQLDPSSIFFFFTRFLDIGGHFREIDRFSS